jgi:hypothetical protein
MQVGSGDRLLKGNNSARAAGEREKHMAHGARAIEDRCMTMQRGSRVSSVAAVLSWRCDGRATRDRGRNKLTSGPRRLACAPIW